MKKKYYIYEMKLGSLNILSIILLIIMFIITYFLFKILNIKNIEIDLYKLIVLYLVYVIIHELLHSLSYVLHGAKFKNIIYGLYIEKGVAYTLCKQNISRKNILNSLLFPLFYIGIITYIIGLIISNVYLVVLSILNISGCSGDIIMFMFIKKLDKNIEYSEFDNPTRFAIYSKEKINNKHFGLKYIGEEDKLIKNEMNKLYISKLSYVFLICVFICLVLVFI